MWKKEFIQTFQGIERSDIWRIWTDINNWPKWHDDLEYCKLTEEFAQGAHFLLKPKKGPKAKIKITQVTHGYSFTDCTTFPLAKMYVTHEIQDISNGVKITNTVIVTGFLRKLWVKLVAQDVANSIEQETENMVQLAKNYQKK